MSVHQHITLCGMMGAGKSAHGRELRKITGMNFSDLDKYIVRQTGKAISEIFQLYGETEFRRLEAEILQKLLDGSPGIIALGGGALQNEETIQQVKNKSILCFIDAPLGLILKRVMKNKKRPLLLDQKGELKPEPEIRKILNTLFEDRRPAYEQAHIHYRPSGIITIKQSAGALHQLITDYVRQTTATSSK